MLTKRLLTALAAVAALCLSSVLHAQFTDARTYVEGPIGLNELEFDYQYARANASIDSSLVVGTANLELNKGTFSYTHNFSTIGHLTWVTANVPFGSLQGSVSAGSSSRSTSGMGDSSFEFAGLLLGRRALSSAELATSKPATLLGASLTVTAPTGEYDANKLLNLGSNRWSFKPELGVSYPFGPEGKWELDGYINAYFFTDNTSYRGAEILRQEPLPGLEAHISYSVAPSFWASLDTRYAFRGETIVNGREQNNAQENLIVGTEMNWSPNSHNSLNVVLAKTVVHTNAPASSSVSASYTYSWGAELK